MDYAEPSKLVASCLTGDELAIERLIQEYQQGVFRLALSILDDPAEANEVAQDTFIAALGALESYQPGTSLKNWLYTIALNASRNRLRKRKTIERLKSTLQLLFQVQLQKSPSPEDVIIQNEKGSAVWNALGKLNKKYRIPMILRYYHDLSTAEIAAILKINQGTVRSRLHMAREKLRVELKRQVE